MVALLIGYARCSTDQQDLIAQRDGLATLCADSWTRAGPPRSPASCSTLSEWLWTT